MKFRPNAIKATLFALFFLIGLFVVAYTVVLEREKERFEFAAAVACAPGSLQTFEQETRRAVCLIDGRRKVVTVEVNQ